MTSSWRGMTDPGQTAGSKGRALESRKGEARWQRALSTRDRSGLNPIVRVGNGTLFCAWLEEGDTGTHLFARWFDGEGQPLGTPLRVAIAGSTTWDLNAALGDDGAACVVFDANVGTELTSSFLRGLSHGVRPCMAKSCV